MKCTGFRKLLIPYAEGSLGEGKARAVAKHLAECESCAAELRSLNCTADLLRTTEYAAIDPAADLRSRVLAQIADVPVRKPWWRPAALQTYSAAMAGLLLVAIAGAGMWSMLQRGVEAPLSSAYKRVETEAKPRMEKGRERLAALTPRESKQPERKIGDARQAQEVTRGEEARKGGAQVPETWYSLDGNVPHTDRDARTALRANPPASAAPGMAAGRPEALYDEGYGAMAPTREPAEQIGTNLTQSPLGGAQSTAQMKVGEVNEDSAAYRGARQKSPDSASGEANDSKTWDARRILGYAAGNRMFPGDEVSARGVDQLEAGVTYFPTSVIAVVNLMDEYRKAGRFRDEYKAAQHLTKLDPDNASHWLARAQAADRVPMPKTAEACYQRAIKLGLKSPQLEQAQERVKALKGK